MLITPQLIPLRCACGAQEAFPVLRRVEPRLAGSRLRARGSFRAPLLFLSLFFFVFLL